MSLLTKHILPRVAFIVAQTALGVEVHAVTIGQKNLGLPLSVHPLEMLSEVEISTNVENAARGIYPRELAAFEGGLFFGWDSPAADPRSYDETGWPKCFNREKVAA